MSTEPGHWCVVPAAGIGQRFGGEVPKQYAQLHGHTVLWHTLHRLGSHPDIVGIVLVLAHDDEYWDELELSSVPELPLPPGERAGVRGHDSDAATTRPIITATGGHTRADSVLAGLDALPDEVGPDDFVLVHDAARPCLRAEDIDRLIEEAREGDGGLLATPLRDTLKRANAQQCVAATEPRDDCWLALTPQMFRRRPLAEALMAARDAGIGVTDESMAMEHAGFAPRLVEGREDNIKITRPADLALAEFLLRGYES